MDIEEWCGHLAKFVQPIARVLTPDEIAAKYAEIERLREAAKDRPKDRPNESADEILRLRGVEASFLDLMKENIRLREELKKMENLVDGYIDEGLTWADIGMKEGE